MDKIEILRIMIGVSDFDSDVLSVYLDIANQKVLTRMFPFGVPEGATVPTRYDSVVLNIACYLVNKRGAEGETAHSENGISRNYADADIPESMLEEVMPYAKIGSDYAMYGEE